jgi:hypothetical protein
MVAAAGPVSYVLGLLRSSKARAGGVIVLIRRCSSFEIGSDSKGDYKHVTNVGLRLADLARRLHCPVRSRDPLCRDRYREVRKFLAGGFFVSSGTCWYLWLTGVSLPIVLPYAGTVSVETPEISGQRAVVHFILFLLCFYFGFFSRPKKKLSN